VAAILATAAIPLGHNSFQENGLRSSRTGETLTPSLTLPSGRNASPGMSGYRLPFLFRGEGRGEGDDIEREAPGRAGPVTDGAPSAHLSSAPLRGAVPRAQIGVRATVVGSSAPAKHVTGDARRDSREFELPPAAYTSTLTPKSSRARFWSAVGWVYTVIAAVSEPWKRRRFFVSVRSWGHAKLGSERR